VSLPTSARSDPSLRRVEWDDRPLLAATGFAPHEIGDCPLFAQERVRRVGRCE